jgi:hypothetical protein
MALGALISLSFRSEAPAPGIRQESKNSNHFRDIQPTAIQPFPLPSGFCVPLLLACIILKPNFGAIRTAKRLPFPMRLGTVRSAW